MLSSRIKNRIDSYKGVGIGYIENYSLRFHKKSKDTSGKADAFLTGNTEDKIWGVIGEIDEESKKTLDKIEDLSKGYNLKNITITTDKGIENAIIYVADENYIDSKLIPFDWYKEFVLRGSIENSLPGDYINSIKEIPCKKDTDSKRREENYKIIEKAGT